MRFSSGVLNPVTTARIPVFVVVAIIIGVIVGGPA
jgi:hypothetical protein